ncbi:MAG: peptidoglycan bridge formation glycyltransferase FemA/FemB family protein [Bacteroidales bacterium]|nr:peptidoglycan bridge formation glycyltransferase FemA/FemB family protein [Bacteroidales bacterium]
MNILTEIIEINIKQWELFVESHPQGTIFQSPDIYDFYRQTKNFYPVIITVSRNNHISGLLLAVIIKEYSGKIGLITSRTVIYGGPLISPDEEDKEHILDILLKKLVSKVKNRSLFIQFRNFFDLKKYKRIFEQNGFDFLERLNYISDTSSEENVLKQVSKSKLRQIKKGLQSGAEIIEPQNIEQVKDFYLILFYLYKNKVKKPLPGWSFFENFYYHSLKKKLGVIRLVKYEEKIIGGILSPIFKDRAIYEWYVCGLDQEYKKAYPSVLATWAAMDYALKNNIDSFDFMGVGRPDQDYGVREFKARFGGELVNYGRYGRINNRFLYSITEIGYNFLSIIKQI